mmetsp:Transcript_147322/g.455757  ORF Transcript_147322/g.455757 Transcript_147322/m.455757 type:complete len:295 (-) Transcript_147322:154-1038(-)
MGTLRLERYDGCLEDAFQHFPHADGAFADFMPYGELIGNKVDLCDDWELPCPPGCGLAVEEVFSELFASGSSFMGRYQHQRQCTDLDWHPPKPFVETPWCASGRLQGQVSVPVLGRRPYEEFQRYMLCRDGDQAVLAYQQVGFMDVGWPMGKVRTESLFLFSQGTDSDGSVRLRAVAPVPPSTSFKGTLLKGTMEALEDFQSVATELLAGRTRRPAEVGKDASGSPAVGAEEAVGVVVELAEDANARPGGAGATSEAKAAAEGPRRLGLGAICCSCGLMLLVRGWCQRRKNTRP